MAVGAVIGVAVAVGFAVYEQKSPSNAILKRAPVLATGEFVESNGYTSMILHSPNEAPPPPDQCEIEISAAYGPQRFLAHARAADLDRLEQGWPALMAQMRTTEDSPLTDDPRADARAFIFEMILKNYPQSDGAIAAITAAAIVWLARTSPMGLAVGRSHTNIHYEITDTGPGTRNYRLMLA
jgi:hypothetical protein